MFTWQRYWPKKQQNTKLPFVVITRYPFLFMCKIYFFPQRLSVELFWGANGLTVHSSQKMKKATHKESAQTLFLRPPHFTITGISPFPFTIWLSVPGIFANLGLVAPVLHHSDRLLMCPTRADRELDIFLLGALKSEEPQLSAARLCSHFGWTSFFFLSSCFFFFLLLLRQTARSLRGMWYEGLQIRSC